MNVIFNLIDSKAADPEIAKKRNRVEIAKRRNPVARGTLRVTRWTVGALVFWGWAGLALANSGDEATAQEDRIAELERTVAILADELERTRQEMALPGDPELTSQHGHGIAPERTCNGGQLPIAHMSGQEDDAPPLCQGRIEMLLPVSRHIPIDVRCVDAWQSEELHDVFAHMPECPPHDAAQFRCGCSVPKRVLEVDVGQLRATRLDPPGEISEPPADPERR